MRKVILFVQVSLDGFFEGPKKEIDWHMVDDELHAHVNEELGAMGAFLSGRVTYELMAGFWPTADADPGSALPVKEFARIWRDMPKVVNSKTLNDSGPVGGARPREGRPSRLPPGTGVHRPRGSHRGSGACCSTTVPRSNVATWRKGRTRSLLSKTRTWERTLMACARFFSVLG